MMTSRRQRRAGAEINEILSDPIALGSQARSFHALLNSGRQTLSAAPAQRRRSQPSTTKQGVSIELCNQMAYRANQEGGAVRER